MENTLTAHTRLPAEIRMTIAKHATNSDPIRVDVLMVGDSEMGRINPGWIRLTQVNRAWRTACINYAALWAENACAYPNKRALTEFFKRAKRMPVTVDLDQLLLACYKLRKSDLIQWLLKKNGHLLRNATYITSTLARGANTGGTFNAFEYGLGMDTWPQLFEYCVYDHLTRLKYHMTQDNDFPRIIDSRIEHLHLVNVQERSITEEVDEYFETTLYHTRGWREPPAMTFETLLEGLNLHKRAKTVIVDAITLQGTPAVNQKPVILPQLARLDLRGPSSAQFIRLDRLIHPPTDERLRVTSSAQDFVVAAECLEHVGVRMGQETSVTVEAGQFIRWTTLSARDRAITCRPIFCGDTTGPEITAELAGDATLLIRPGTVSRKYTKDIHNDHDPFLGAPRMHITQLVVRELTRKHGNEWVWQMPEHELRFIDALTSLKAVRIEDERVASSVCQNLWSTKLASVEIVCRPDWSGASTPASLVTTLELAANRTQEKLVVIFSGAKRFSDKAKVDAVRGSRQWTVVDRRVVVDGIPAELNSEPLRAELQWNRKKMEEAKTEVKIFEATKRQYPWL